MKISHDEVVKVAALARLNLSEEKIELFGVQFNDILDYIHTLNQVETNAVEPLYSPVTHSTVFRDDVVRKDYDRDALLANAPENDGQFFVVPRIVG
ncbi:MAG TPA: Asp-tRNA(Asn)/Glu-tRNA(Gln) amidotransferase subunit GatC [Desulfonatronum sp.]|nr:Asp-tRNA(Asn)/Glu-tRNA(Gln) amidotransferase subunit GatC [Desulfonatronum sp.]